MFSWWKTYTERMEIIAASVDRLVADMEQEYQALHAHLTALEGERDSVLKTIQQMKELR